MPDMRAEGFAVTVTDRRFDFSYIEGKENGIYSGNP